MLGMIQMKVRILASCDVHDSDGQMPQKVNCVCEESCQGGLRRGGGRAPFMVNERVALMMNSQKMGI